MKNLHLYQSIAVAMLAVLLPACDFQKNVTIDLPTYEQGLVVECYLEKGKPMRALLTESSSYFDTLAETTVKDARVTITKKGQTQALPYSPMYDLQYRKIYTHRNYANTVPDYNAVYSIDITDPKGRHLTGTTRFLPEPVIDSVKLIFQEKDTTASLRMWIKDDPNAENYYRILVNRDSLTGGADFDRTFQDQVFNGQSFPFFTNYRYKLEDTLYVRVFNIEKPYFDFLRSLENAQRSNGNPFTQPASAQATVQGGYGVFTTLNYVQKIVIVKK
ncbi:DUF4249 domain-containing protein [Flexibacter flexilis]|nr:DUF4249 domain-containing protein [Flexibacter flexilis]